METPVTITMEIPFPVDRPNVNNIIFSSDCLDKLMNTAVGKPITTKSGEIIGQITKVLSFEDDILSCEGTLYTNGLVTQVPSFPVEVLDDVTFQEYVMR